MTVNEKMKLVIDLAEQALEKNELPIACIIFHNDTIVTQSHTSESKDKRLLVHAEINALHDVPGCSDIIICRKNILFP